MNIQDKIKLLKSQFKKNGTDPVVSAVVKEVEKLKISIDLKDRQEIIAPNPNGKTLYSISFSEYSSYLQCPHKWFLSYQLKFPGDASEELLFGSAVHDSIECTLTNPNITKLVKNKNRMIFPVLEDELKKQIAGVKDVDLLLKIQKQHIFPTFYKQGKEVLEELNIFERFAEYEVIDVEYVLDGLPIGETDDFLIVFKGFIDLVLRHKETGRYLILDWKTSGKAWDINKKEKDVNFYNQLLLYRYFYSMSKGVDMDQIDLCFFNLPRMEPNKLKLYPKTFSVKEVVDFKNKFEKDCMKILNFSIFALQKAKHKTKDNFCHRCKFNKESVCNDIEEYQTVLFEERDKL